MQPAIMSSREFNQHTSKAQKAADSAPVFITHRGKMAYVLMRYEEYQQQMTSEKSLADVFMELEDTSDIEFELPARSPAQRPIVEF